MKLVREKSRSDTEIQYQNTCELSTSAKYLVVSADMQKTLQIPKLKHNYFCEKLNVYNLTFAKIGVNANSICVLSHEEQMNKNASDVCNYYLKFLFSDFCQKCEQFVIKCDNALNQNKCWLLLTNLIRIVNDINFKPISITIDYYEDGHSFQLQILFTPTLLKK